jgi:crotonobetainyl-CoA:carnitine CoA-transferase CaiB-like acyl-CoA transferase
VAAAVVGAPAEPLAERAQLLGMAVAALAHRRPAVPAPPGPMARLPVVAHRIGERGVGMEGLVVVDLSALWAGPLCSHLLQQTGARVIKVESVHRPDGARAGPPAFFDLLHAGQHSVALDFRTADGRSDLRRLIGAADVVVEGSRPRALEQLGIDAETVLAEADRVGVGPQAWISITGYGRAAPGRDRVAFGDDAAAAGGLVVWDDVGPCFCADAVADPCTGIVAAAAALKALAAGGRWLLDISMRDVAAHLATPQSVLGGAAPRADERFVAAPPRARRVVARGPCLGEHTEAVFAELGLPAR